MAVTMYFNLLHVIAFLCSHTLEMLLLFVTIIIIVIFIIIDNIIVLVKIFINTNRAH